MVKEKPFPTHVRGHPVVPENVLRKRKTLSELKEKHEEQLAAQRAKRTTGPTGVMFKKASYFIKEYRQKQKNLRRINKEKRIEAPEGDNSKLLLVMRHKGSKGLDDETKKILNFLHLREVNCASLIQATSKNLKMINLVAPYIKYGVPTLQTLRDLIQKRGYTKIEDKKIPLTDNQVIEDRLGNKGIVCLEDLINEIHNVGPNFLAAVKLLQPFKLKPPRTDVKTNFRERKMEDINDTIARMN
uniref:Ribosomal protein L30 ferredoxin-like fold domain-containing protein n=1 Tax=Hanusia phi TaxID=3032 RepID=A0A7S0EU44_9CRYP|mmetsp:Transcript_29525/g.66825  ORF Transcript_29525/g.66825 Transcript_29525/m.66825 type:complete len:243 (+) Transcript_29525:161-889(+)